MRDWLFLASPWFALVGLIIWDTREKGSWRSKLKDPLALFTAMLVLATMALVWVAALQWETLDKTDRTLRLQERAWLTPFGLNVGTIAVGKDLPIKIFYANFGKGPAINMHIGLESVIVPYNRQRPADPIFAGNNRTCEKVSLEIESVPVFPIQNRDQWQDTAIPGINILNSVVAGERALVVRGCFKYRTVEEEHTTAFCYVAYRDGVSAAKDNTVRCADGNEIR